MTDSINLRTIIGAIERKLNKLIFEFKLLRKTFRVETETHEDRIQELEEQLVVANNRFTALEVKLDSLSEYIDIRDEDLERRGQIFAEQANREDTRREARRLEAAEEESIEEVL